MFTLRAERQSSICPIFRSPSGLSAGSTHLRMYLQILETMT
jgi:hypothetical protein